MDVALGYIRLSVKLPVAESDIRPRIATGHAKLPSPLTSKSSASRERAAPPRAAVSQSVTVISVPIARRAHPVRSLVTYRSRRPESVNDGGRRSSEISKRTPPDGPR